MLDLVYKTCTGWMEHDDTLKWRFSIIAFDKFLLLVVAIK